MVIPSSITPIVKRLEGKVAVITGGASGIGEAATRLFTKHGAKVVVADVRDDLGRALCKELGSNDTVSFTHCDVTNKNDMQNAVDGAVLRYGKLDIMFSNAGITGNMKDPSILATDYNNFKNVFDVNVYGAFLGAKIAAKAMIPTKKGSILFTSSIASVIGGIASPITYASSKHAVVGLAKHLAVELGQYGIRVNCISPYTVATPLVREILGKMDKEKAEEVIMETANLKGTILEPEDIAEAAVYLGSDESKYVSGINLVIDGGYSKTNPLASMVMQNYI
ncbi:short chain aldehyde dehydrogenase 1-like [Lycium ferocissimum]|uniref:short chain aldehyde dehydrogenase 1-like n=1 Tax=Lycium ferocissimum TaxID=112874 RepID=UPI002814D969|nr:short chain aldehyde dehydrogenase 1-like [Lycium ferocissimum]